MEGETRRRRGGEVVLNVRVKGIVLCCIEATEWDMVIEIIVNVS